MFGESMAMRNKKGSPQCMGKTRKKAWRNPLAPAKQCTNAARKGCCTCAAHAWSELGARERLSRVDADSRGIYGELVPVHEDGKVKP